MSLRPGWAAQQDHFSEALTSDGASKKIQIIFIKATHGRGCGKEQNCWPHNSWEWMGGKKRGWGLDISSQGVSSVVRRPLEDAISSHWCQVGAKPLTCGLWGGHSRSKMATPFTPIWRKILKWKFNFAMENLTHKHYLQEEHRQQSWRRLRWVKTQENLMVPYWGINILNFRENLLLCYKWWQR